MKSHQALTSIQRETQMAQPHKILMQVPHPNGSHLIEGRKLLSFDKDIISVALEPKSITVRAYLDGAPHNIPSGTWLMRTQQGLKIASEEEVEAIRSNPKHHPESRLKPIDGKYVRDEVLV